jgi:hypothetical protein
MVYNDLTKFALGCISKATGFEPRTAALQAGRYFYWFIHEAREIEINKQSMDTWTFRTYTEDYVLVYVTLHTVAIGRR